jgi:hypothetical protein
MENNTPEYCKICGATLRWKEGGKRTDGSTYDGFMACPDWKKHPAKPAPNTNYAGKPSRQDQIKQAIEHKDKRIDEFVERKEESILNSTSVKNATTLLSAMVKNASVYSKLQTTEDMMLKLEELARGVKEVEQKLRREDIFKTVRPTSQTNYEEDSRQIDAIPPEYGG